MRRKRLTSNSYLKKLFIVIILFSCFSTYLLTTFIGGKKNNMMVLEEDEGEFQSNLYHQLPTIVYESPTDMELGRSFENKMTRIHDSGQGVTVLFIPHSHCDPGWLSTFNEYFEQQVIDILNNVVQLLVQDSTRTFVWSEIWWDIADELTKVRVKLLISNGQLEFIGGGWVQNDEAVAQMDDVIDQITEGLQWLKRTLNVNVEYGWQIDPFGHSSLTPMILSRAQFKGIIGNRINLLTLQRQRLNQEMDFIWQPSRSSSRRILTHLLYDHYSYPSSYPYFGDLEIRWEQREFVSNLFFNLIDEMRTKHKTKILLLPFGNDFAYQKKDEYLFNEQLIDYMLARKRQNGVADIRFGTLREYFQLFDKEIVDNQIGLPLYTHDYLPLVNDLHQPWTGFFTQFSLFKKLVRDTSLLVKTADMFYSIAMAKSSSSSFSQSDDDIGQLYPMIEEARRFVALTQHHDGVTGTARQFVMMDYRDSLNIARQNSYQVLSSSIEYLIHLEGETDESNPYEFRDLLDLNEMQPDSQESFSLVFHNSLSWKKQHHYTLRIRLNNTQLLESVQILDSTMEPLLIQIVPMMPSDIKELDMQNDYMLVFIVEVPAFGINTYFLTLDSQHKQNTPKLSKVSVYETEKEFQSSKHRALSTRYLDVKFQPNGFLSSLSKTVNNQAYNVLVKESINQYSTNFSGNYVFIPEKKMPFQFLDEYKIYAVSGPLLNQVTVASYMNNINVTSTMVVVYHRLYNSPIDYKAEKKGVPMVTEESLELGYSLYGFTNLETVFNFQTNLDNDHSNLYTDNGQESRSRIKPQNNNDKINFNYYPVLNYAHLKDNDLQFTVFTERSHGVGSNNPSDLEIMIHRTTLQDDSKGLEIPGFDYSRVDAKLYLSIDHPNRMASFEKQLSLHYSNAPIVLSKQLKSNIYEYLSEYQYQTSFFNDRLPNNLHIHSIKHFNDFRRNGQALLNIRLSHLMADSQASQWNNQLSNPISLNLNKIFNSDYSITYLNQTDIAFLETQFINMIIYLVQKDFNSFYRIEGNVSKGNSTTGESEFGEETPIEILNVHPFTGLEAVDTHDSINLKPLDIKSYQLSLKYSSDISQSNLKFKIARIQPIPFDNIYTHDFSIHKVSKFPMFFNDVYR
ncbi:alpha-mannosidase [Heterostelium album PN500]|uniref:Alpha-mannosidase n=1 Tax=Heterostelium pallidum (strain ATCC 26659 / Pp 5 / PN500) TaxID=670386 RepID=D3BEM6_HETP5|nr:alpha-mannosidase [Heterostelium album PN500]EFA80357.1 alpha-mannosidase [Heterostelium album PN500]|eukprot:XP_020432477.1 alpha-mannosidase [Heterostelium album PN500]